jgi:hypothetical protein
VCVARHGSASGMHGKGPTQGLWGVSARTGRTRNICCMFLTLDVLKLLSGWLNTVASCRVKGRAYDAERGAGWEAEECACGLVAAQVDRCARGAGSDQGWGGQGTSGAHQEHVSHVRDRGGVEVAERLVE